MVGLQLHADPSTIKPCISSNGLEFLQLYQYIPVLGNFYTSYEKEWRARRAVEFAQGSWPWLPLAICVAYALMIVIGQRVMKDRKKFEWRQALAYWNLMLSLFSFCGMVRTVPHLLHSIATKPFRDTICTPAEQAYGEGACGLWVMLFIYSKVPELGDTVFIVFRKARLEFIHYYHHITVLLFCWHSYATASSTGLYFVAMNYSVHAIMYGYFYLNAIKAWPKQIPASLITVAQISQMIVGTSICLASYYYLRDENSCAVKKENVVAGVIMYGSYLYLFCDFFVRRFILKTLAPQKKQV